MERKLTAIDEYVNKVFKMVLLLVPGLVNVQVFVILLKK